MKPAELNAIGELPWFRPAAPRLRGRQLLLQIMLFATSCTVLFLTFRLTNAVFSLLLLFLMLRLGSFRLISNVFSLDASSVIASEILRRNDTMPEPNVAKETEGGENENIAYVCSSMQGWRRSMEDAHFASIPDRNTNGGGDGGGQNCSVFGVFDGHCGAFIAQSCGTKLWQFMTDTDAYRAGDFLRAMSDGFVRLDRYLSNHPQHGHDRSGSTANVVLLTPRESHIFCANAGDSRSVLCRDGGPLALSEDHKPQVPSEHTRITRAHHFVFNRRVDGVLAMSRAIGDFVFKKTPGIPWEAQAVTCVPDVQCVPLDFSRDSFVLMACDGIWDVVTNEQAIVFVKERLGACVPLRTICEELMQTCLSSNPIGAGCDNMTVILVVFKKYSRRTEGAEDRVKE